MEETKAKDSLAISLAERITSTVKKMIRKVEHQKVNESKASQSLGCQRILVSLLRRSPLHALSDPQRRPLASLEK